MDSLFDKMKSGSTSFIPMPTGVSYHTEMKNKLPTDVYFTASEIVRSKEAAHRILLTSPTASPSKKIKRVTRAARAANPAANPAANARQRGQFKKPGPNPAARAANPAANPAANARQKGPFMGLNLSARTFVPRSNLPDSAEKKYLDEPNALVKSRKIEQDGENAVSSRVQQVDQGIQQVLPAQQKERKSMLVTPEVQQREQKAESSVAAPSAPTLTWQEQVQNLRKNLRPLAFNPAGLEAKVVELRAAEAEADKNIPQGRSHVAYNAAAEAEAFHQAFLQGLSSEDLTGRLLDGKQHSVATLLQEVSEPLNPMLRTISVVDEDAKGAEGDEGDEGDEKGLVQQPAIQHTIKMRFRGENDDRLSSVDEAVLHESFLQSNNINKLSEAEIGNPAPAPAPEEIDEAEVHEPSAQEMMDEYNKNHTIEIIEEYNNIGAFIGNIQNIDDEMEDVHAALTKIPEGILKTALDNSVLVGGRIYNMIKDIGRIRTRTDMVLAAFCAAVNVIRASGAMSEDANDKKLTEEIRKFFLRYAAYDRDTIIL